MVLGFFTQSGADPLSNWWLKEFDIFQYWKGYYRENEEAWAYKLSFAAQNECPLS